MKFNQKLMDYFHRGSSSILDTLSGRNHSPDFAYARNQYLASRLRVISWLFVVLSPFWALFDQLLLPAEALPTIRLGRVVFFFVLLLILILTRLRIFAQQQITLSMALLLTPTVFYAFLLYITAPYELPTLANYQFIPFLLVATLSIFPFTLLESLAVGCVIILVQLYSFYLDPNPPIYFYIQELWLLCALLTVAITANHFHLNLLLRLYRQATHDQLTGLLNRHALLDLMEKGDNPEQRWQPFAVFLLDLDHFKKVNDQYGHAIGDKILQAFAEVLRENSQSRDRIARYGGEEFLLIRYGDDLQAFYEQAEQLRNATMAKTVSSLDDQPVSCTVSIGLTLAQEGESLDATIQRADEALYTAKEQGRNQVVVHTVDQ